MRFLIVEPEKSSRMILLRALSDYGSCDTSTDGDEALRRFNAALKTDEAYDFVFINVETLESASQLLNFREIEADFKVSRSSACSLIFATAKADTDHIVHYLRHGCQGYLLQPFEDQAVTSILTEGNLAAAL